MEVTKEPRYTIHTIAILRNEIKNYGGILEEKKKVIKDFKNNLLSLEERLEELDDCLVHMQSDTWSSKSGGYKKGDKIVHLLYQKEQILKQRQELYDVHQYAYLKDMLWWQARINTIEYYLSILKPTEREFIEDLYIHSIKLAKVKEKYGIEYDSDLYRKANHILKKVL